ncbi:FecR family protein [Peristeroidobacter soli]|uniref:FecR family protein n=1 Tax=Peristeroidobacter soli TaxID=2497877 RepID=UPI00101C050C|nr:FecR domain-containing protein [Peristeroidobacter soli]
MIAPKFSRAELRRRLKTADLAIQSQEGSLSASDRQACRQWRSQPGNEQTFREMAALLRAAKKLSHPPLGMPEPRRSLHDSIALKAAAVAGVGIICGLLAFPPTVESQQQLVNQTTQWHPDNLKDGSGVFLGPGTAMDFQVNDDERKVAFKRGQALFKVKKDTRRPFVVRTGDISVVAVGTEFAVKLLDGPPEVTVTEGTVRVEPARGRGRPIYVHKGEQLTIAEGAPLAVRRIKLDDQIQWSQGIWNANGKTVTQVVAELNRRNLLQIDIDETALPADTVINATVKLDDPMTFAQALALEHNLVIDRQRPNVLLVTTAKTSAR